MQSIFPEKFKLGDHIRVIAPARSLSLLSEDIMQIANTRLQEMGFRLSFGKHVKEMDDFSSTSIEHRLEDLHEAFLDKSVNGILTVIGGFNSNQLLRYLDWNLIRNNPKIFCGYSDITALNNAILAKTGLVSYSGPFYSTFGQELYLEYTLEYFKKCLLSDTPFEVQPSEKWSDDFWWKNQQERNLIKNDGFWIINEGQAMGTILGANLCTFNLLQGTEYFPDLKDSVLFLEDDEESLPHAFDRDLQSLIHLPSFMGVRGMVIGRFQKASEVSMEKLTKIIKTKKELQDIPVIGNVDFGHTDPKITFPIGGKVHLEVVKDKVKLTIQEH